MKLHSKHTQKTITRMVLAKLGKKRTPEHIASSRKGRVYTPLTAEHKEKISRANKGRTWSHESIEKRKATIKANPRFYSPEYRKKLSDSAHLSKHKRLRTYMENKFSGKLKTNGKRVLNIDTGEIYFGASEVARMFNRTRSAVSYSIINKMRTCGGKRLVYLDNIGIDDNTTNVEVIRQQFKDYVDGNKIVINQIKSDRVSLPTLRKFYNGINVRNSTLNLILKLLNKLKLDKQV